MVRHLVSAPIADSLPNHPYENSNPFASSSSTSVFSEAASSQSGTAIPTHATRQSAQECSEPFYGPRPLIPDPDDSYIPYARRARALPASCTLSQAHPNALRSTSTWPSDRYPKQIQQSLPGAQAVGASVPQEQRQNPRRCSLRENQRPPQLVRQTERRLNFVDSLVDSATQMVEAIWPLSSLPCRSEHGSGKGVLPLRTFIQETLRRSRTSYSTLQVALYYLILIKSHVPGCDFTMEQPRDSAPDEAFRALQCGRRMFLAALILASKYLQDRNFSARAWSKISGLKVTEINTNERAFLAAIKWKLHLADGIFERWTDVVLRYTPPNNPMPTSTLSNGLPECDDWKSMVMLLTPELEGFEAPAPSTPMRAGFQLLTGGMQNLQLPSSTPTPTREQSSLRSTSGENTPTPSSAFEAPPVTIFPTLGEPATALPRYLEPRAELPPPTPSLIRLGPLPTPQLTPSSVASNTPAASTLSCESRRPSICSAMQQAQQQCMFRSAVDHISTSARNLYSEASSLCSRRLSTARSSSSGSSPESMISDTSRISRASSISSVSSTNLAPGQANANLCRLATCRNLQNMRLPFSSGPGQNLRHTRSIGRLAELSEHCEVPRFNTDVFEKQGAITEEPVFAEEITSSPEYDSGESPIHFRRPDLPRDLPPTGLRQANGPMPFNIPIRNKESVMDSSDETSRAPQPGQQADMPRRKRGRSSTDAIGLQQNVRDLLTENPTPFPRSVFNRGPAVAEDNLMAESFLLATLPATGKGAMACALASASSSFDSNPGDISPGPKAMQSPSGSGERNGECRRPVVKPAGKEGRKRACCGKGN